MRQAEAYYLFPVAPVAGHSAEAHLRAWLEEKAIWGVSRRSNHRARLKAGDRCCFYAARAKRIVAHAVIAGSADTEVVKREWPSLPEYVANVFKVPLSGIQWLDMPVRIDSGLRSRLEAFRGKDPAAPWNWFVRNTYGLSSEHDFHLLIGKGT
jgi:hypothetical protein